jgi:hypothetical protein
VPTAIAQKLPELRPGSVVFSPASSSVRESKRDTSSYRHLSVHVPPAVLSQLSNDAHGLGNLTLLSQAGPVHAELCRVMLAMKDEIDEPGAAGTLYKETLALQLLIQIVRCRLSTDHSTGERWAIRTANCVGPSIGRNRPHQTTSAA